MIGEGKISVPYVAADRDRWAHYAMTFADGRLSAFRDGRLVDETPAKISVQSTRAVLGRHWWSDGAGTSARFQGALDDIRVYDRALSQQQIQMLMNSTR